MPPPAQFQTTPNTGRLSAILIVFFRSDVLVAALPAVRQVIGSQAGRAHILEGSKAGRVSRLRRRWREVFDQSLLRARQPSTVSAWTFLVTNSAHPTSRAVASRCPANPPWRCRQAHCQASRPERPVRSVSRWSRYAPRCPAPVQSDQRVTSSRKWICWWNS